MPIFLIFLALISSVRPQAVRESKRYEELVQEAMDVSGARLADKLPIQVLDVGTGLGSFLPKIREYLESRGYIPQVIGIDIYPLYQERNHKKDEVMQLLNRVWKRVIGEQDMLYLRDIHDMMPEYAKHFDIIFINAPHPRNHIEIIKASLPLMKEDASLVVRYAHGEENEPELYEFVRHIPYTIMKLSTNLPRGRMELNSITYVIMRNGIVPREGYSLSEIIGGARLARIVEEAA